MPKAICLLFLLTAGLSLSAQDVKPKHSAFGCSDGAVSVDLNKHPPLRFKLFDPQAEGLVGYAEGHEFVFIGEGPFLYVSIGLMATLPESGVGTASTAKLAVYAHTAESADEWHSGRNTQWWRLESVPGADSDSRNASTTLTFEARRIAGCFDGSGAENCSFADVALATPDKEVPLISVGFTENLGGANAANWTEARLLLDFRSSPPTVAITTDCGYNEGGGACTTYDSQQMERTNLQCDWKGDTRDFLCSEESTPSGGGHRDFYLLGDNDAPLRADEVASLNDALAKFKTAGHVTPVKVRGIGPVSWLEEVRLDARKSVIVLASSPAFYFVTTLGDSAASAVTVYSRPFLEEDQLPNEVHTKTDAHEAAWTPDAPATFISRPLFRDRRLAVLQAVERVFQAPSGLYWIGIDYGSSTLAFDVVQLAGGGKYAGCARYDVQATAVSIGHLSRTLEAALRVQPATVGSETDHPLEWKNNWNGQEVSDCVRAGKIWWQDHKFKANMASGDCPTAEKPHDVKINDDGTVTLIDAIQP